MLGSTKGLLFWYSFTVIVLIGMIWAVKTRRIKWPEVLVILITYGLLWTILGSSLYESAIHQEHFQRWKRDHPGQHRVWE